jgi:hypothetical protein
MSGDLLLHLTNPVREACQTRPRDLADLLGSRVLPVDVSAALSGYSDARTKSKSVVG